MPPQGWTGEKCWSSRLHVPLLWLTLNLRQVGNPQAWPNTCLIQSEIVFMTSVSSSQALTWTGWHTLDEAVPSKLNTSWLLWQGRSTLVSVNKICQKMDHKFLESRVRIWKVLGISNEVQNNTKSTRLSTFRMTMGKQKHTFRWSKPNPLLWFIMVLVMYWTLTLAATSRIKAVADQTETGTGCVFLFAFYFTNISLSFYSDFLVF